MTWGKLPSRSIDNFRRANMLIILRISIEPHFLQLKYIQITLKVINRAYQVVVVV